MTMSGKVQRNDALDQAEAVEIDLPEEFALTFEVIACAEAFRRQLSFELEVAGLSLTPAEARVLVILGRNQDLRQTQLAQLLSCAPMTLVGVLDRLEAAGLVKRKPDEDDHRAKRVLLEVSAVPLARKVEKVVGDLCIAAEHGLDRRAVQRLRDVLSQMRTNLAGMAAGEYPAYGRVRARGNSASDGK